MKQAFTMIELIFTIVIIGILSVVAIPKLSATRDDAIVSRNVANARNILGDFQAFYAAQGSDRWQSVKLRETTDVPLATTCGTLVDATTALSPNTFYICEDSVICLSFTTEDNGTLTIADGADTTSAICEATKIEPAVSAISNKTYILGGSNVER